MMRAVSMTLARTCENEHQFLNDCALPFTKAFQVIWMPKPSLDTRDGAYALIRNTAASINPADWEPALFAPLWSKIPGIDSSGVLEEVTPQCLAQYDLHPGDPVWSSSSGDGFAAFSVVHCSRVGRAPKSIDLATAAAVPITAITDLKALYKLGAPWTNKPSILITAAAGGCGLFAVQIAKHLGAGKVIATASPSHFELVRELGADEVMDYHERDWWDVLGKNSVDRILDIVPLHPAAEHALEVLKDEGMYLQLAGGNIALFKNPYRARGRCIFRPVDDRNTAQRCVSVKRPNVSAVNFFLTEHSNQDLDFLRDMVDEGKLRVVIDSMYNFTNVHKAFIRSEQTHTAGKMVMVHNFTKIKKKSPGDIPGPAGGGGVPAG